MSSWERPPPLPQRPRPEGQKQQQQQHHHHLHHDHSNHRPGPYHHSSAPAGFDDEKPPPLPSRPRSRIDLESITGSIKESWKQLRTGLDYEDASGGLKPPALPPRPVSASAVPDRQQRPISPNTSYSGTHSETHVRTPSSSYQHGQGRPSSFNGAQRRDEDLNRKMSELNVSPGHQVPSPGHQVPSPGHQVSPPDVHHSATPQGSSPAPSQAPPQQPPAPPAKAPITAETACINIASSSPATWYSHRDAPNIYICSRCYVGYLRDTRFRDEFEGKFLNDGTPRACRFSTPRIQKHLLVTAAQTGSLGELLHHMKRRATIPNCKGVEGTRASEGIKWFNARDNAIPGMVICEACWEDFVVVSPFAPRFQPVGYPQDEKTIWACDMAVPYIRKELDRRDVLGDWTGFAAEAGGRLQIPPCGKAQRVPRRSRKWLCPKDMPSVVACPACFCDHVVGSGEEDRWREWTDDPKLQYADNFICALGQFGIGLAMSFAEDRNDYSLFWGALVKAAEGPECNPEGTKGATWYTLRDSDPRDFFVCGLCYAAIVEPMGMRSFFMRKPGVAPDAAPRCCLNPRYPRFMTYLQKLLDGYFAQNTDSLSAFAVEYAGLPQCKRYTLLKDAAWYGWPECTICPECYHEFIRGTALADAMPYQGGRWETSTMCKMYSHRMRTLYLEACAKNPPDATEMLAYSEHRTGVYVRTIMVAQRILVQQRLAIGEQQRLNAQSLFYTSIGNAHANTVGSSGWTYGAAGVGYGFENSMQLDGARYGKQAREVAASVTSGSASFQVAELERQWEMVE